jgi:membrane-bound lytic murein transglycosylase D
MKNSFYFSIILLVMAAISLSGCSLLKPLLSPIGHSGDDESVTVMTEDVSEYSDTASINGDEVCLFAPDDYLYYCQLLEQTMTRRDTMDFDLLYGDLERQYGEIQDFTNVADSSLLDLKRQYTHELTSLASIMLGIEPDLNQSLLANDEPFDISTEDWAQNFSRYSLSDIDSILYAMIHMPPELELSGIPEASHELVDAKMEFFTTGSGRKVFQRWMGRSSRYSSLLQGILDEYDLPGDLIYLAMIESGFSTKAYSWAHAAGPWQFIGSTAKMFGLRRDYWVDERYDPIASTHAAAQFLRLLYNRYDDWYLAFAAYNSGPGRVDRALRRHGTRDYWQLWSLPKETRSYVPLFLAARKIAQDPERWGFTDIDYQAPLTQDTVLVAGGYRLQDIAESVGAELSLLEKLNPAILREVTPPGDQPSLLKLPAGTRDRFLAALPGMRKAADALVVASHKVRYGETLSSIALRYGVSVSSIRQANNLSGSRIYSGQTLVIRDANSPIQTGGGRGAAQNGGEATRYRVKRGDTLSEIALRYGISVSNIRKWNGIGRRGDIYAGQSLKLYLGGKAPQTTAVAEGEWLIHTVKSGENASLLAERYGVALTDLRNWNSLNRRATLLIGQKLKVGRSDSIGSKVIEYQVKAGDSLWKIAEKYHVTTTELRKWNNLGRNVTIHPGDKLLIHTEE